jgi:hypothetical protein
MGVKIASLLNCGTGPHSLPSYANITCQFDGLLGITRTQKILVRSHAPLEASFEVAESL